MVNNKIKISELAKDFNLQGKDVCAALSAMGMNYKPSQSVSTQEVGMLFDYLTQKNQVNSLDDVRATAVQAAEQRKRHGVACERMHRLDDARTGDERGHDDEREREAGAHDRPALERAALPIDGEGVHERHADEPREQASVLDRVPTPIAAPTEHDVGPYSAQADASAQEQPAGQHEARGALDPELRRVLRDERGHGIGERHGQARVAHEQHGRMDSHGPMFEQLVH